MKKVVKNLLSHFGYRIINLKKQYDRRIGSMDGLLLDLKERGLKAQNILDVGANRGSWSRMAKKIFPDAEIFLIEPQVEMKEDLEKFCHDFPGSTFKLAGAGAQHDLLTFTVWDNLSGSSFLPKPDFQLMDIGKQRDIEVITIDNLLDKGEMQVPDIIKLDIQGFELEALKGADSTFGKTEVFIMEVSLFVFDEGMPVFSDAVNFMLERNYVVYDFPGFLRRPFDGALGQCDVCFVKRNGFLRRSNQWS